MNFDFGQRWAEVVPFLTSPDMRGLLQRCWTEMRADSACYRAKQYDHQRSPASQLTSRDGWATLLDSAVQLALDNADPRLPPRTWSDNDSDDDDSRGERWMQYEDDVRRAIGLDFRTDPSHIAHWAPAWGSCHWFSPTIGLHLANHVCPDTQWAVLSSPEHTTVVSADGKKVFDLLAWSWDRLHAHVLRDADWVEKDATLGGAVAIEMASGDCVDEMQH